LFYNQGCKSYEFKGAEGGNLMVDYIKYLYKFLVGIAGILAVFMIMYGGMQWIFSGGNPSKITAAKETIFGAVIGLFLAVGSYTLLRTVNPSLVTLNLKVPSIAVGGEFYKEDGSCKDAADIPCGYLCTPLSGSGASVMGECKWCSHASTETCGKVGGKDKGKAMDITVPASKGNCWYAKCGGDKACTYASSPMKGVAVYTPECQPSLSVEISGQDNKFILNDNKSYLCGTINLVTSLDSSSEMMVNYDHYRYIGSYCFGNSSCIIDLSKGYYISDLNPTQFPSLGKKEIGFFNNWSCIP